MTDLEPAADWKLALVDAYMDEQNTYRRLTVDQLLRLANEYVDLNDVGFVGQAAEIVMAGQREAGAYAAEYISVMGLDDVTVDPALYVGRATRDGTLLETVYNRPGYLERELLEAGLDPEEARAQALNMLQELGDTDVAVSARISELDAMTQSSTIWGYVRVPNPDACDFCLTIATRVYGFEGLVPAHNYCRCGVEPLLPGEGPPDYVTDTAEENFDQVDTVSEERMGDLTIPARDVIGF